MFEKYNLIQYSLTHDGKKLTDYILTDITTRAKLKAPEDALIKFKLNPGETPEDVSYEVYQTPYYHWAVMMVNNIFDVNSEWFMADQQLYDFCVAKYNKGCAVAAANISAATDTFNVPDGHTLDPNDPVMLSSTNMPGGLNENTVYYVFNTTATSFQLTANIHDLTPIDITSVGDDVQVTCDKLSLPAYWIDDLGNIISSAWDVYEGWSNDEDTRISYKNQITDIIYNQASRDSYITAQQKSITEPETDVLDIVEQVTPLEQQITRNFRLMTNFEYEEMMNSRKQYVWIIKPEYIKTFVDLFNKAIAQ